MLIIMQSNATEKSIGLSLEKRAISIVMKLHAMLYLLDYATTLSEIDKLSFGRWLLPLNERVDWCLFSHRHHGSVSN